MDCRHRRLGVSVDRVLNFRLDYIRQRFGWPCWSFSAWAKTKVKTAVCHFSRFEVAVCMGGGVMGRKERSAGAFATR
jgi:hypothetical protein